MEHLGHADNLSVDINTAERQLQCVRALYEAQIFERKSVHTVDKNGVDLDGADQIFNVHFWAESFVLEELVGG